MLLLEIVLIGVSLAMDAFAVSITDGVCYRNLNKKKGVTIPITFAVFQMGMPLIGFFVGSLFMQYVDAFDHYIAFGLLLIIGGKMIFDGIREARAKEEEVKEKKFSYPEVLLQGVATSIDALAVGLTLNSMMGDMHFAWVFLLTGIIGVITFVISLVGLLIGVKLGKLFKSKAFIAEIIGGAVLIGIGIKILVEGLI